MATNFPGGVDNFTNPQATDPQSAPSHSAQHSNANDAIEAIQAYLLARIYVTTSSTTITVADSDHGKFYRLTATTAVTVNLPDGVNVGTQVEFQACDTGLATFVLSGTAAWGPAPVPSAVMLDTGSACTALCVATDTWTVVGRLA